MLHRPTAFEPGEIERLLAHHVGAAHLLRRDDIGFLDPAISVRAFRELGSDLDRTILFGDLDDLSALDVQHVARLRRFDAFTLEHKLGRDARRLDGFALVIDGEDRRATRDSRAHLVSRLTATG